MSDIETLKEVIEQQRASIRLLRLANNKIHLMAYAYAVSMFAAGIAIGYFL